MLLHAPAKLNLCLYLGPRREDGLHELCSLFEPLALADLIEVSEAERDEVICPGVEGENLAARALAALRERGWERPPLRVEIEKRVPVAAGLGGGSADAAAILRLAAGEVDDLPGAGRRARRRRALPAAVPALALVRGAGERVEPLPEPAPHAAVLLPDGGGLSTAEVFAEADRLGLGRERRRAGGAGGAAARRGRRRRLAARLPRAARQRPRAAGALAAPGDRRRPRRAARSRRPASPSSAAPARPRSGSSPTSPPPAPRPRRSTATTRSSARRGGRREDAGRERRGSSRKQAADRAIAVASSPSATTCISQRARHLDLQELLEDISNTLGAWTYLLVGVFAFAETGAFVGLVVPGETVMLLGGAVAGQGAIDIYLLIAIAWFSAWAGDTTSFFLGRRLGREFVMRHGPRFGISHERFEQVEDYFSRHGGKTIFIGRFISLVRAFAPFIAGSSGMRYRAFVPYSILGTGLWASAHILVGYFFSRSIETARQVRRQRRLPARHPDRRRRRRRSSSTATSASPRTARAAVRWMEAHAATRWLVALARRSGPQLELPLGPGHPGRHLRARVHLADGGARRRPLRPHRLRRARRPRAGPDPGRHDRDRRRRTPARRLAHRPRQGRHLPRLRRLRLGADRGLRGAARRPPPLGRGRGAAGRDGADLDRRPRDQGRRRPAAARRAGWSTPRAPRSRAATPPTRSSTSGWR